MFILTDMTYIYITTRQDTFLLTTLIKKRKKVIHLPVIILICNSCHAHVNRIKSILPAEKWTPPSLSPFTF